MRDPKKMRAPQGILEGQYVIRPPYFNGQHYNWWKNRMENYIQADDYGLWIFIENGPYVPMKTTKAGKTSLRSQMSSTQIISKRWRKALGPRSCCTLALEQVSALISESVSPQRRYGMPSV